MRFVFSLILICVTTYFNPISASHSKGGYISYNYVGPGSIVGTHQYEVLVLLHRGCIYHQRNLKNSTWEIEAKCSSSGASQKFNIPFYSYVSKPGERASNYGKRDISSICRSRTSTCNDSLGLYGHEEFLFKGIITLGSCNSWKITAKSATPRSRVHNFNGTGFINLITNINNTSFPANNSCRFPKIQKAISNA
ncbi:MAG: hypothetical protein CL840_16055 [Crocinitomicaceae bacterium]|nr:hypothetical protein [Crocinitomicaceae bacterium]